MNYHNEKAIVLKLVTGLAAETPAVFLKTDEEEIRHLINADMVKPNAFKPEGKKRFGAQNLNEREPVTGKGKQLFGL